MSGGTGALRRWRRMAGDGLCVFLGLGSSALGWIPALTGLPVGWFVTLLGVGSVMMGWWLTRDGEGVS